MTIPAQNIRSRDGTRFAVNRISPILHCAGPLGKTTAPIPRWIQILCWPRFVPCRSLRKYARQALRAKSISWSTGINKLMCYMDLMVSRGLSARSRVVYSGVRNDEYGIATRLSLPSTCPLIKIERVRLVVDEPFSLETCFLSAKEFAGLVQAPLERSSLFATLNHEYGVELAWADEEIDAVPSDVRKTP